MSEILKKIQSRGYWKVIIRPAAFVEKRIDNLADLHSILRKAYVQIPSWRWEFPHLDFQVLDFQVPLHKNQDLDWIGQEYQWEQYLEVWRFYQSGQFVSIKGVYDDWQDESSRQPSHDGWRPCQLLEVEDTLLQFNEIFEFAARLAFTKAGDEHMRLKISVHNLKGRGLKLDMQRKGSSYLRTLTASIDELPYKVDLPATKLIANPGELALTPAVELFQRFGWNPSTDMLRDIRDDRMRQ